MAQLGNRILFYEIVSDEWTEDDLMKFAQDYGTTDAVKDCQRAVNLFIDAHFRAHPVDTVDPHSIEIPEAVMREIVRYGKLIAHGRVEVSVDDFGRIPEAETPEGPQRVILLLQSIIRGLALAEGRMNVSIADLIPIRHIAFSSIPRKRRELLRALLVAQGSISSSEADKALGVSRSTASSRMKELAATQIVVFAPGDQQTSTPDQIELAPAWRWLLEATPFKQNGGVCGDSSNTSPIPPL
jgi:hypothetical protein